MSAFTPPNSDNVPSDPVETNISLFAADLVHRLSKGSVRNAAQFGDVRFLAVSGALDEEILKVAANDPRIAEIQADLPLLEPSPQPTTTKLSAREPPDIVVQNPAAWHLSRLSNGALPPLGSNFPNSYTADNTAQGVRIYILDRRNSHHAC